MSILHRLAHMQGRRDEVPNQELARELAQARDKTGIRELVDNLANKDKNIQGDCIKALYEIGTIDPSLIASYAGDFIDLLASRHNRLVWGAAIALATIGAVAARDLFSRRKEIQQAIANGSVITIDNGIKALALVASSNPRYRKELFPYLLKHLQTCRDKDIPQHSEHIAVAVSATEMDDFVEILESRMGGQPASRLARIKKLIRKVSANKDL